MTTKARKPEAVAVDQAVVRLLDDRIRARTPGVIRTDEVYTVSEFRRRTKLGDYAWRQLRRELRVVEVGRKQFIIGADWLDYLTRKAQADDRDRQDDGDGEWRLTGGPPEA